LISKNKLKITIQHSHYNQIYIAMQQLAGLLISRQIIGNIRESAMPYIMEQWRLATLSFKLWGALSPTKELPPSQSISDSTDAYKKNDGEPTPTATATTTVTESLTTPTPKRSIGQAEIESAYFKVKIDTMPVRCFNLNIK
jgi:anoctamin-8